MAIATPAPRVSKEVALRPIEQKLTPLSAGSHGRLSLDSVHSVTKLDLIPQNVDVVDGILNGSAIQLGVPHATTNMVHSSPSLNMCAMIPERDIGPVSKMESTSNSFKAIPHRPVSGPEKLTIRSTPVKSQPPMLSAKLSNQHRVINNTKAIHSPLAQMAKSSPPHVPTHHQQPQPQQQRPQPSVSILVVFTVTTPSATMKKNFNFLSIVLLLFF